MLSTRTVASRVRARAAWWWLAPAVLAVLGAVVLGRGHGFWYDEVYTAEVARVPLGDLVSAVIRGEGTIPYLHDAPPSYNGPYYAFVHLWLLLTPFGATELGLRLLSLLAAVAAVVVFGRAVDRLAGRRVAMAAALFVATNPFVVQYAVEARGYALALLGTSLAVLGVARWLDGGDSGDLIVYGLGGMAAGLFHWYSLLVLAGLALAAVLLRGARRAAPVVSATVVAAVPAAVVAGIAVANGVGVSGVEWLQGVGLDVPWLVVWSWSGRSAVLVAATLVTVTVGLFRSGPARLLGVCWVGVPLAVVTAIELMRPVFVDRYLLPAAVGLALLMALGAVHVRPERPAVTAVVTGAVVAASLWASAGELARPPKDDVRSAVSAVAAAHRAGQPVVAAARWDALGVEHYVRREHPELAPDLVLPSAPMPPADSVWVIRRARGGVIGDDTKLEELDGELAVRGLKIGREQHFDGRYADVLVQRWDRP